MRGGQVTSHTRFCFNSSGTLIWTYFSGDPDDAVEAYSPPQRLLIIRQPATLDDEVDDILEALTA